MAKDKLSVEHGRKHVRRATEYKLDNYMAVSHLLNPPLLIPNVYENSAVDISRGKEPLVQYLI